MSERKHQISTMAIRGGRALDKEASSILYPLFQTGTFVHDSFGVDKGYGYSRVSNPTVDALEKALGALEDAPPTVCCRTGMAAVTTLFLSVLKTGDHVVLSDVIYGGTMRLFREVLENLGVTASFVDGANVAHIEAAIIAQTKVVFIETPANPTLKLTDIAAVAALTKRRGILLVVDNTFLTPALQRPFELGADVTLLSTTKYIDGHNMTVGGSLASHDEQLLERFRLIRKTLGTIQAPFEAWLTLQGMKTLPARLRLHCENALAIAEWLEKHPAVSKVYFPGLESFPQKALAEKQQDAAGAMLSFELKAGAEVVGATLNRLRLLSLAESLGGLETLITHPATTTHADIEPELRAQLGVTDGLIRMSIGLEAPEDVIADLEQALAGIGEIDAATTTEERA